jgi:formylglycine-generating enzyme required for sulfatase activity
MAIVLLAIGTAVAFAIARQGKDEGARCAPGFVARAARCGVPDPSGGGGCPAPLVLSSHGCDAPDVRVLVPAAGIAVGPSDWEAEGRVRPRSIRVGAFHIDAFEVTVGRWNAAAFARTDGPTAGGVVGTRPDDAARAASGMTRAEAAAFCDAQGGRLPTEDEWIAAAASAINPPRRYPWGDTGAVCRRAAWGLVHGPCATSDLDQGPDAVGAHPDGDSPLGLHDLAGNVAEWVAPERERKRERERDDAAADLGVAKGGCWRDALASDLRIWSRRELPPDARDACVGFRCAYPP